MATNFPTSLDAYTDVANGPGNTIFAAHVNDPHDAIEAIEAKLGIGASTPVANTVFAGTGAGVSSWSTGPTLSGTLTITAVAALSLTASAAGIEMGATGAANTPFIDFHSSGNNIDYDARLVASGGTGSVGQGALEVVGTGGFNPDISDGVALGTSAAMWSDLFLASGAVINFNNGDVTLTHSLNVLTFAGGSLDMSNNVISNIGAAGTDFTATGGLNLAGILNMNGINLDNPGGIFRSDVSFRIGAGNSYQWGAGAADYIDLPGTGTLRAGGAFRVTTWPATGDTAAYRDDATGDLSLITSDERLKKDLRVLDHTETLRGLMTVRALRYRKLDQDSTFPLRLGVVAQDFLGWAPEMAYELPDQPGYYGVHYDRLPVLLLAAFQAHERRIAALEASHGAE